VRRDFSDLQGLRVLAVEDEFIVHVMLEDMLAELGCEIVGSASRVTDALGMIPSLKLDAAVLDINIGGAKVYPVAQALAERDVPLVFATGYGKAGISDAWRNRPIVQKPYHLHQLADALARATTHPRIV
jgi:CheY-like chemotaxis protein